MDMVTEHNRMAIAWEREHKIRLSEGRKPNRSSVIDEIDIGLINSTIFCVDDVLLHNDLF